MELEKVTVWKHSLNSINKDLVRAKLLLGDLGEWVGGVMDTLEEKDMTGAPDGIYDTLYRVRDIMSLLAENMEKNEVFLDRIALKELQQPAPHQPPPPTPVVANIGDFTDIPTVDLLRELVRQECIIEAAGVEAKIIHQALALRGEPVGGHQQAA